MADLSARALQALLSVRLGDAPLSDVLQRYTDIARDNLPGADEVSVTLVRGDRPFTAAYSGQLALDADELQYERGYGPCIDAGLSGVLLRVDDMRAETRWPDYAAKVVPRGVLSSLSVPLPMQTDVVGALNCYAREAHAFSERVHGVALELAGHVGVAVANAVTYSEATQLAAELQTAMLSRATIEQAKGIIMAQNRCDADTAFDVLRRASMGRNVKL
ncbi:MAG TPA: GAF and ANTAR domain-containing protein, partial [Mycobacteriales bacterium]|nr:GAF and ANTAR domain-containing protein [Mycobacteriales bacterium]